MARCRRHAIAALAVLGAAATPAHADHLLTVRAYDAFGLPSLDHVVVRASVDAIFARAGINVRWRSCPATADAAGDLCAEPLGTNDIVLRMVASPTARSSWTRRAVLGSVLHTAPRSGSLATVFVDQVIATGRLADGDSRVLLGRVIAHELGHLLLGNRHSKAGLMRGQWTLESLALDIPGDWVFSRREALELQKVVLARLCASASSLCAP